MDEQSKSIFLSKTFWGVVIAVVGHFSARFGWSIPGDPGALANDLVGAAGDILALWGRLSAYQPVHVVAPSGKQKGFATLPLLIVLALVSALFACSITPKTPDQGVFQVTGSVYASALSIAVAYKELPSCSLTPRPALCADAAIVSRLQAARDCAEAVLVVAQKAVRGGVSDLPDRKCGDPNVAAALAAAGTSVPMLQALAVQTVGLFKSLAASLKTN